MKLKFYLLIAILELSSCNEISREALYPDVYDIENGLTITATINGRNGNYNIYDRMKYYGVPGVSIAVINNDAIQFAKGYGYSKREEKDTVNSTTLFQAASVSKPITCLAVMKMFENNLISLDTDVNDYLKGWQIDYSDYCDTTYVTLKHLLSHRSGLTRGSVAYYKIGEEIPTDEIEMLNASPPARLEPVRLKFKPGTNWSYSGGGYTVIQKAIEDVLGISYEKAIDSLIFQPLRMNRSFFDPTFTDRNENVAVGYNYDGSPVEGGWMILTELAAAGLWTTPSDMLKFIDAINNSLNNKPNSFLKTESAKIMLKLGLFVDNKQSPTVYSFRGTNKGYRCEFIGFVNQEQSYGAVVMTNSYNGRYLIQEILRSIASQYEWRYPFAKDLKEFILTQPRSDELESIVGRYAYKDEYVIEILEKDTILQLNQMWNGRFAFLYPISVSLFVDPATLDSYEFIDHELLIVNERREYHKIE